MQDEAILLTEEIASIKDHWPDLLRQKKAIRRSFYTNIFKLDPKLIKLFRDSFLEIDALPDSWLYMYDRMTNSIIDIMETKKLGLKHKTFKIKPNYYPIGKIALLKTLEEFLGDDFTENAKEGWSKLFDFFSDLMIKGSKRK